MTICWYTEDCIARESQKKLNSTQWIKITFSRANKCRSRWYHVSHLPYIKYCTLGIGQHYSRPNERCVYFFEIFRKRRFIIISWLAVFSLTFDVSSRLSSSILKKKKEDTWLKQVEVESQWKRFSTRSIFLFCYRMRNMYSNAPLVSSPCHSWAAKQTTPFAVAIVKNSSIGPKKV